MIDQIGELIWRATLFMGLLYALDYALDGKLDLPGREIEWEETRLARWIQELIKHIHKKEE